VGAAGVVRVAFDYTDAGAAGERHAIQDRARAAFCRRVVSPKTNNRAILDKRPDPAGDCHPQKANLCSHPFGSDVSVGEAAPVLAPLQT